MPGRLFLTRPLADVAILLNLPGSAPDNALRRNIKPGEEVQVIVPGPAFCSMRWGMIPVGCTNARGRPVLETIVNARSETVFSKSAFQGVGRAVVPVDGWYEWTGKRGRKTAWKICAKDGSPLFFAGISDRWTAPGGREIWQVATVTCPPNADVRDIHDRMGVLLAPSDVDLWLNGDGAEVADLMRPAPDGSLAVVEARDVDWSAP